MATQAKKWTRPEATAQAKRTVVILSSQGKGSGVGAAYVTNYYAWNLQWRDTRIGEYGADFHAQFLNGASPPFNLAALLDEFPMTQELPIGKEYFVPSAAQHTALMTIPEPAERDYQERMLFQSWYEIRRNQNSAFQESNEINKIKRSELIKSESTSRDTVARIFADVLASMDKLSQEKVNAFTDLRNGEDYGMEQARAAGDWMFLFIAARSTQIARTAGVDGVSSEIRNQQEEDRLKNMKHASGPFHLWVREFRNQLETIDEIGLELSEDKKKMYFMSCIHPVMFAHALTLWNSFVTRTHSFPDTFEEVVQLMIDQHQELSTSKPDLVQRCERRQSQEQSFGHEEKRSNGPKSSSSDSKPAYKYKEGSKCPLCKEKHDPARCKRNNPKFSLESNIAYAERRRKQEHGGSQDRGSKQEKTEKSNTSKEEPPADEDEDQRWNPTKGTYARPPTGKKTEKNNHLIEFPAESEERCFPGDIDLQSYFDREERINCFASTEQIIFTLDTGTETGTVDSNKRELLTDIVNESVCLQGVSGSVHLTEIGSYVFGKARVLLDSFGRNLVSFRRASSEYQLLNPDPYTLVLKGWQGTPFSALEWVFVSDLAYFGDELYHCAISRGEYFKLLRKFYAIRKEYCWAFYRPTAAGPLPTNEQILLVDSLHKSFNHASAEQLIRMIECESSEETAPLGVSKADVLEWKASMGTTCPGCIRGKMTEHQHLPSSNPAIGRMSGIGDGAGDIMFVDHPFASKTPMYVHLDRGSKYIVCVPIKGKDTKSLEECLSTVIAKFKLLNHPLLTLTFDRESAIISIADWIVRGGVQLYLKAAKQKVGDIEVSIRYLRESARSSKAGVHDDFGFRPPAHWNIDLLFDVVGVKNMTPREGQLHSPYEILHGHSPDKLRNIRVRWGQPVIVKRPKGIASDLHESGSWAIIVRRTFDGSGIVKVYLVETRKYAWRLNFKLARIPSWISVAINSIAANSSIGFENGESTPELAGLMPGLTNPLDDLEDEAELPTALNELSKRMDATAGVMSGGENEPGVPCDFPESFVGDLSDDIGRYIRTTDADPEPDFSPLLDQLDREPVQHQRRSSDNQLATDIAHIPPAHSKREVRPVIRLTYAAKVKGKVKFVNLFDEAFRNRPDKAMSALDKELDLLDKKKVWKPILMESLSSEDRALVLNNTKNYVEKYRADGVFEKSKVRILARGDRQTEVGLTEGPVCRVESIHLIVNIALLRDLKVMKIDFVGAYLNTPMPAEVKQRWILLDKHVSARLVERDPELWKPFLRFDGRILVEMLKLLYGYKEAAYYWNKLLLQMFVSDNYTIHPNDPCVVFKREDNLECYIGITVDDCATAISRDADWENKLLDLCRRFFGEYTIEEGESVNIVGMTYDFNYVDRSVKVSQKKFIKKLIESRGVTARSKYPCGVDLFESDPTSPLVTDQFDYMSVTMSCMYTASRTYPETLPTVGQLAAMNGKATVQYLERATRAVEYLNYDLDHHLLFRPRSLRVIASADASYAEHENAMSHTGGCVGIEGMFGGCFFIFVSSKQKLVSKSSAEAELIAGSTVGEYEVWLHYMITGLGLGLGVPPMVLEQDNMATIRFITVGHGSFKRTKHFQVRFFWLYYLVKEGTMVIKYVPSLEMTSDILSKPMVGSKFLYLRRKLLGQSMPGDKHGEEGANKM